MKRREQDTLTITGNPSLLPGAVAEIIGGPGRKNRELVLVVSADGAVATIRGLTPRECAAVRLRYAWRKLTSAMWNTSRPFRC